jgi:hypothetical protein
MKESANICATHNVCASGVSVGSICAYGKKPRINKRGMGEMAGPQLEMSRSVWGTISSVNGRVAGPALRAVDEEAMHLIVLGVQQDRLAVTA